MRRRFIKHDDVSSIIIDQNVLDPKLMISGDIGGTQIQLIRQNSHRYLGKYINDKMIICQLDDQNSNFYADGSPAILTGSEGDVFMKLPQFWYRAEEIESDVWRISFSISAQIENGWKEHKGNDLIGVYESYISGGKMYSRSGQSSTGSVSESNIINASKQRGEGYCCVLYKHQCLMAFLFYALFGTTDCQSIIGKGVASDNKLAGQTNELGMRDTDVNVNGNKQSINFWGLENWWGNKSEIMDGIFVHNASEWLVREPGCADRIIPAKYGSGYPSKILIGEFLDTVPVEFNGSRTTGYCDSSAVYYEQSSRSRRSQVQASLDGGLIYMFTSANNLGGKSAVTSRLCYIGNHLEEKNVESFKSL